MSCLSIVQVASSDGLSDLLCVMFKMRISTTLCAHKFINGGCSPILRCLTFDKHKIIKLLYFVIGLYTNKIALKFTLLKQHIKMIVVF